MRTFLGALALTMGQSAAAHQSNHTCPTIKSSYVAAREAGYRLTFGRLSSRESVIGDVAVHIEAPSKRGEIWYYFDEGSLRRISLISTTDPTRRGWHANPDGGPRPHGTATYIGMDAAGRIAELAPKAASKAPHMIVIPELAEVYRSVNMQYTPAAFVLSGCR